MNLKNLNILQKIVIFLLAGCLLVSIFFFSKENIEAGIIVLFIPFVLIFISVIFRQPIIGLKSAIVANYFVLGVARYLPGPLGLSIDGFLVLTWISLFFSQFNKKPEWNQAKNILTYLAVVWFSYSLFQLINPETVSRTAWFYAMRGVSLYMLLIVPLVFILLNKPEHLKWFVTFWAWATIFAVLKGMMQKFLGTDPWETRWLDLIGGKTHRLPQGLRIFSFFSDAATYGGSMGFSGVVFAILGLQTNIYRRKILYLVVSVMAFYGMLLSGTRGAIAVPFGGFALYAILSKRFKIVIIGGILMVSIYSLLKYTTIGEGTYEIRRFRQALNPENPSLLVRKENQKKFRAYLADKPFGGGIGSAGNWGLRFTPGTFLAETPPDGWYVQIWAEQGIVGLILHLGILLFILFKCCVLVMFKLKNKVYIAFASAMTAGLFGVMLASYSSSAIGQMPNGIIIYVGISFIFLMPGWEKENNINGNYVKQK